MSSYNQQGTGRAKDGVIQCASYAVNRTNSNDTMGAIKTVAGLYRASKEAILAHEAEKNKKADENMRTTSCYR